MRSRLYSLISVFLTLCLFGIYGAIGKADAAEKRMKFAATCTVPKGTIKRKGGVRTFTLRHGQKGHCPNDNQARHRAPYWERAEVRSTNFKKGRKYRFSVDINFDPNAGSSDRTTFFQVHQYNNRGCTWCFPAVMIKTNGGTFFASILINNGFHVDHRLGVSRTDVAGEWTTFTIEMGTDDGKNDITISVNGTVAYQGEVHVTKEGLIYVKSGLYRPGSTRKELPTDRLSMRNMRYEVVN